MVWNRKEPPKIVAEVAQKLDEMKQPVRSSRPLLEQIHTARLAKQVELNRIESELNHLLVWEHFIETHAQADSLILYFLNTQAATNKPETKAVEG